MRRLARTEPVSVTRNSQRFRGALAPSGSSIFIGTRISSTDDAFATLGTHSLKFGFAFENIRDNELGKTSPLGQFVFGSLSDFLQDQPTSFNAPIGSGITPRNLRQSIYAGYVMDDWRARPNMTLNLRLRYEAATVPSEAHGKLSNLPSLTSTTPHLGDPFFSNPTKLDFEPRVGFAWDPLGNGKTSIRSGFGIFDNLPLPYLFAVTSLLSAPFFELGDLTTLPQGSFPKGAFPLLTTPTLRYAYIQPNPPRSYEMEWNFNIQQSIARDTVLQVGYTGSRGVHLPYFTNNFDMVIPTLTPQGYVWPVNGTVLNPNVGQISGTMWNSDSIFHALEVQVTRQLNHGLQAGVSYAWGKIIDSGSESAADGLGEGRVNQLRFDGQGALWIASEGGLGRLKNGRITTLTSKSGLPCDAVQWTMEDDAQSVWIMMPCGLVRVARSDLDTWASAADKTPGTIRTTIFDNSDGLRTLAVVGDYTPRVAKSSDGKLWFSVPDGISVIDPHHLPYNNLPPPVHIEKAIADRKEYLENLSGGAPSNPRPPPLVRELEIDYTALSLVAPEKVLFRYKLEGWDQEWQDAGTRRQAFYSNLPPRNYTFHVQACNNSGLWNEAATSLDFSIAPAYYQTYWFRLSCFAAFGALLWALYRWRIRQVKGQEKRLRDVVETIPAMTFTTLSGGSCTFVNKRWTEYTGLSVEQSSGSSWQSAVHAEDLARYSENWRISVATGQPFEDEARFRRAADGEYRWFLVRGVPLRDQHGKIVRWYGTLTDIEDRKRAGDALQRSELYLREGQRLAHTGSWALNSAGLCYWSSELFHVYGLDPGGNPPTIKEYLDLVHPEDRNFMEEEIQKMLTNHCEFDFTKRIVRPDGKIRYVRCVGVPVTEGITFQGFVGTGMDVTEQKQFEEERERIRQLQTELAH